VIHRHSAVCTHAGCIVHWDSSARIWACPCHGSRFGPEGEVLNGPATEALAPVEAAGRRGRERERSWRQSATRSRRSPGGSAR
jgi:Rieske Fe-S protein